MPKKHITLFLSILTAFGIIASQFSGYNLAYLSGESIEAKVLKIYDGDTATLSHNGNTLKVRLYGIDAPELKQKFGAESRNNLKKLCPIQSSIQLQIKDKDKYGRIVGILKCNNQDANAMQVSQGYAWAYKEYSLAYIHLELKAKLESKGLWSEENPIKPSLYRKQTSQYKQWATAHIPPEDLE
ncbi:hypothetical protein T36_2021 [Helicobacter cinaedi]|uniref:thermonuclease family protein n=1 Tax=Helicobacter cinaedi TaxID=213 RepID=UPI001F2BB3E5|nr:thermonuclease family protein [Helicobacter cinaedi]BDB64115.1 hypothetical protein T36_0562 [Helicobacter cinaedi]BDB65291.1 hypothetical protein T36_1767 [Helicobacter cinaedi]BDB65542.1 hypothetical protein T36_2021 [Helicobacter cinaedi]